MFFTTQLNTLLQLIVQSYGQNANCIIVMSNNGDLHVRSPVPIVYVDLKADGRASASDLTQALSFGCQMFLFLMDDYIGGVDDLEEAIKVTDRRFGRRKLVFVPNANVVAIEESRRQLFAVLDHGSFEFVPDVLLLLPSAEVSESENSTLIDLVTSPEINITFELVTHKYVGLSDHHEPITLDFWNAITQEFLYNNNLFPDKLLNYQGRILRLAAFNYPPYSIIDGLTYDGTEMRIGLEYARQLNSTVEIVDDEAGEWGIIYDNRTGNGILGNLVEDRAEIGYAALYTWFHEYGFLDLSLPVVRTGITCLTPAPRLLTSWMAPLFPFTAYVWIALVLTELVATYAIKFISTCSSKFPNQTPRPAPILDDTESSDDSASVAPSVESIRQDKGERWVVFSLPQAAITSLALLLLQPFPLGMSAISASFKHLLLWLLLLALLITCSYSSGLATSMTIPRYEDSIKTVEDLADYRMDWGATHDAWIFSILEATQPLIVQVLSQFRTHTDKELRKRTQTGDFSFSIERLPAGHFAIGNYITAEALPYLQAMSEDIYWEQCVLMMRKSSPHLEGVNTLIGKLHAAGLMHFWEGEVARKYLDYKVQLAVKLSLMQHGNQDANPPVKLRTSHLKGMYVLWAFGIGFSLVCFLGELTTKFYHKNRPKV